MRHADFTGQVLDGRYRVIEPIGNGAMGSVYRGERVKLGRIVAIKVLNDAIPDQASLRRFEREAKAMAKLEHPNCGSVLDVGVHNDRPYVVMEFVSGQNLKEVMKAGPIPRARAIEITRQVLSALSHAHALGIIHRDIKPANIVLSQKAGLGDHVKLLDFGLVRFSQDCTNLTGAMVLGTPNYMAPEQIHGGQVDHRVDVYACGVMLFELLTGQKPFHGGDPVAVCMQHVHVTAPRLAERAPGRSFGALEDVVARALAKDPAARFASADEFSQALGSAATGLHNPPSAQHAEPTVLLDLQPALVESSVTIASPATKVGGIRRTWMLVAGGVLVICVGTALIFGMDSEAKPSPVPAATPTQARPAPAAPTRTTDSDPVDHVIVRAQELAAAGRREAALDLLLDARKTYSRDGRLPYHVSILYLEKMWWADGLKQARAAIDLDPAFRTDPELIRLVLKGFNTTKSYDWTLAKFLREDIGDAAKPFLEETASGHPNPIVRKRAAAELKRYH
jgi:eukaryotic-like serine/threonine-protein kinase